ncbi:hypothetical protein BDV59DRAFT_199225 [Aspergillus ambiguus]|uniref:uncharacterized protein n=1 Tax=Aspergillus ambiguus TaxID=176160 RepID=UPI003CCD7CA0
MAVPSPTQDLKDAIEEALSCTSCILTDLTRFTFQKHLRTGLYHPRNDPPFTVSNNPEYPIPSEDEPVSPRTVLPPSSPAASPTPQTPSYQSTMCPSQRSLYHALISAYQAHDPKNDVHVARYRVDYHIHLHYLHRRGMLTLCRNTYELHAFREWKWKMRRGSGDGTSSSSSSSDTHLRPRRWGWPYDAGLFSLYQMPLWRRGWRVRREKVVRMRAKWSRLVDRRRRQRRRDVWRAAAWEKERTKPATANDGPRQECYEENFSL